MSGGWSTKLQPDANDLADIGAFTKWLEIVEAIARIFVHHEANPRTVAQRTGADAPHQDARG